MLPKKWFSLSLILLFAFPSLLWAESDLTPTASFYLSPSSGSLETQFSFDASASYDSRGFSNNLDYRWNFDYSSGGDFGTWDDDPTLTHQYTTIGEKTVALEVRDEDGATDRTYGTLNVSESPAFSAWFDVSPTSGNLNTSFNFSAQISTKASVSKDDFQVRWDFEGDATYDTSYSTAKTAYHTYSDTGYYNPHLQVRSPEGEVIEVVGYDDDDPNEITFIYVAESEYPEASIAVYPSGGSIQTQFYFDGSKSFDAQDHKNLEYRWDFEGDGLFDVDWSTEMDPTHKYEISGTYNAILQVRDGDGHTDEVFTTIIIGEDNLVPEADFTITSDSGLSDKTLGTTSTTFTLNASVTTDEEDTLSEIQVRWDFEGDGSYDTTFDTQKTAEHRYLEAGTYTIVLQVIDTDGQKDTHEETVTIVANDGPVAFFEVDPLRGTPGTVFSFDASASSDSQYLTSELQVRWDFDGDGSYDTVFAVDKTTTYQYEKPGEYTVTLQVKDPESKTSTATQSIEVVESTAPVAELSVNVTSGTFSTLFQFDGTSSHDGETFPDELWFRWDLNYTGTNDIAYDTSWSRANTKSAYFDQPGDITVRLDVKDEEGNIATNFVTINIHWASAYMDYLKDNGILKGYSDGDMAPDQQVTRAELLKMALKAVEVTESGHTYQGYFTDVKQSDWFDVYVEKAYEMGIVKGYSDGSFHPNSPITRAEAMKILMETFDLELERYENGSFPDVHEWDWFADYVATAYEYGLINGYNDGYFRPNNLMTRGEASKILALAMQGRL